MSGEIIYSIVLLLLLLFIIISCFMRHYKVKCERKIGATIVNGRAKIIVVVKDIISP